MGKIALPGINMNIGGNNPRGRSGFFVDWSLNTALLFIKNNYYNSEGMGGLMIGVSLGLGYAF